MKKFKNPRQQVAYEKFILVLEEKKGTLLTEYFNTTTKVKIRCINEHIFEPTPKIVTQGHWCKKCTDKLITMHENFLTALKQMNAILIGDYVKYHAEVEIVCCRGHLVKVVPVNIVTYHKCPKCPNKLTLIAMEKFHEKIAEKGGIIIEDYVKSSLKTKIKCSNGHIFEPTPNGILNGNWCSRCAKNCPIKSEEKFHRIIAEKGGKVLGKYVDSRTPVLVRCFEGHEWGPIPEHINRGSYCMKCSGHCPEEAKKDFFKVLKEKNWKLQEDYIDATTKIEVKCSKNHEFKISPSKFRNDRGCRKCAGHCPIQAKENFLKIVAEKKGELKTEYVNTETYVKIECEKGHLFETRPEYVRGGSWCSICNESRGEQKTRLYLERNKIDYKREFRVKIDNKDYRFDFLIYFRGRKILIEFDGIQHFEFVKFFHRNEAGFEIKKEKDYIKTKWAIENTYCLLRIDYKSLEEIDDFLEKEFSSIDDEYVCCFTESKDGWMYEELTNKLLMNKIIN